MNIVVAGGAGPTESNFVRHRIDSNDETLAVLDKPICSGNLHSVPAGLPDSTLEFVQGAIGKQEPVLDLLCSPGLFAIVDFAAGSHVACAVESPGRRIGLYCVQMSSSLETACTHNSLLVASDLVAVPDHEQGLGVCCPLEVACRMGCTVADDVREGEEPMINGGCRRHFLHDNDFQIGHAER